jgi:hypothetical protein
MNNFPVYLFRMDAKINPHNVFVKGSVHKLRVEHKDYCFEVRIYTYRGFYYEAYHVSYGTSGMGSPATPGVLKHDSIKDAVVYTVDRIENWILRGIDYDARDNAQLTKAKKALVQLQKVKSELCL